MYIKLYECAIGFLRFCHLLLIIRQPCRWSIRQFPNFVCLFLAPRNGEYNKIFVEEFTWKWVFSSQKEKNAFVLDHRHGRCDVICKPAIGLQQLKILLALWINNKSSLAFTVRKKQVYILFLQFLAPNFWSCNDTKVWSKEFHLNCNITRFHVQILS